MKRILKKSPPLIMFMLACTLLFSANSIVNAASKTPKKISMHVSSKIVDIKGESKITIKTLSTQGLDKTVSLKSSNINGIRILKYRFVYRRNHFSIIVPADKITSFSLRLKF